MKLIYLISLIVGVFGFFITMSGGMGLNLLENVPSVLDGYVLLYLSCYVIISITVESYKRRKIAETTDSEVKHE